jgi:hypothetical protein
MSFTAATLCVASERVTPKVRAYFVIDSVRKLLDTLSHLSTKFGVRVLMWGRNFSQALPFMVRVLRLSVD